MIQGRQPAQPASPAQPSQKKANNNNEEELPNFNAAMGSGDPNNVCPKTFFKTRCGLLDQDIFNFQNFGAQMSL